MEIPAKIQIKHLGNLERIHRQNLKFIDQADVRGVWILRAPGVGKIHFARQVLVAEGYYPTLNNKWWDGYQSQKVVIMEDVDKVTVKFLHHHPKIWGFGRSPMVFGVWEGGRGREAVFLEPVFSPGTAAPSVLQGRCSAVSDFIGRCEGKFMEIPAKIQIKHLGNLERIHRQNLKFIDQADVRGVWILRAQESARSTLPAKCW